MSSCRLTGLLAFIVHLTALALASDPGVVSYSALTFPPPLNWIHNNYMNYDPGSDGIDQLVDRDYSMYNASGFAHFMLGECQSKLAGSCIGFSILTTGAYDAVTPYRTWYGVIYDSDFKVTLDNFRRDISDVDMVQDTFAWVIDDGTQSSSTAIPSYSSMATSAAAGNLSTAMRSTTGVTTSVGSQATSSSGSGKTTATSSMSSSVPPGTSQTTTSTAGVGMRMPRAELMDTVLGLLLYLLAG